MTNTLARHTIQLFTMIAAMGGVVFALRIKHRSSMATSIMAWLAHVAIFYGFVFGYRRGWVPYDIYVLWLSPWTPAIRFHGVIAAITTLYLIRRLEKHG